jgi:hypothetical protein
VLHDAGPEALERRKDLVPDPSAKETRVGVRGIDTKWNPVTGDVRLDIGTTCVHHRSNPFAAPRGKDRQSASACASKQAHDQCFRSIIRVMARRDPRGTDAS